MKTYTLIVSFLLTALWSTYAQETLLIDDFENGNQGWAEVNNANWISLEIVDNPSPDDLNSSPKVMKCVRKLGSNTWAGGILRDKITAYMGAEVGAYRFATVKFLKESSANVGFKIESGPGNTDYAVDVPYTPNGKWHEITFDLGGAPAGEYKDFFFMVDLTENLTEEITVYVDDIILKTDPDAKPDVDDRPGEYQLVWFDEFDGTSLDQTKWSYDTGTGDWGWGNNEKQYYTTREENIFIRDGVLVIRALKENYSGSEYTSAKIHTRGKGDFLYGKMEARLKLPAGRGTWPAFWMMPTNSVYGGWPHSGEIDIMEYVGYQPGVTHGTVHRGVGSGENSTGVSVYHEDVEDDFHVFTLEWTPNYMKWYFDDEEAFFTYRNLGTGSAQWPFDQKFYIILNFAVGGNWGGAQGIDDSIFPSEYLIDYIKVYQKLEGTSVEDLSEQKGITIKQLSGDRVKISQLSPNSSVEIYSVSGAKLLQFVTNLEEEEINLSAYPNGMYIVRVINADSSYSEKILKK